MNIDFEWEEFQDYDNSWWALFVRINGGRWMMAKPKFDTEDQEKIKAMIQQSPDKWI